MSDLAPFVAAAITDKVVLDLMEENKRLRKVIEHYNVVNVTGPSGLPIYSRSQFDVDGRYDDEAEMWRVTFQQIKECQLLDLAEVEIHRAGSGTRLVDLDDLCGSLENDRDVVLTAGKGANQIELCLKIEGLSEVMWHSLARASGTVFTDCLMKACSSNSAKVSFQYIMLENLHVACSKYNSLC